MGTLDDGRDDSLYGRGVVRGDVSPHDMPPLTSQRHLEAEDVWAVEVERLKSEVLRLAVKYGDSTAI